MASMSQEELEARFGALVQRLRRAKGYSQEGFAFRVGIHPTYLNSIEKGKRNVSIRTANRIAEALDLTLVGLFVELERDRDVGPEANATPRP